MNYSTVIKFLKDSLHLLYPDREIESVGRLVLEHLTGLSWVQIRLNQDNELSGGQEDQVREISNRLLKHEPIQYILGETEFYGLKLRVRSGVLIPRGETEELVDWIVDHEIRAEGRRQKAEGKEEVGEGRKEREERKGLRVLDIGCGSGAIAVALAKHLPDAEVVAADISAEALEITRENAVLNGLTIDTQNGGNSTASIRTLYLDILSPEPTCHPGESRDPVPNHLTHDDHPAGFDIIVSNPPYVPAGEMTTMDLHVIEFEPATALFVPDDDPLLFYRAIAQFAASNLNPDGQVFVEIHDRLGQETAGEFRKWFSIVELRKDIHGKDRMIRAYHG